MQSTLYNPQPTPKPSEPTIPMATPASIPAGTDAGCCFYFHLPPKSNIKLATLQSIVKHNKLE